MLENIINKDGWIPPYYHHYQYEYIFLTSLNLGGAEKIVCDQLWANYYCKFPTNYTLIVLYDKEKEHSLPPGVRVVRLNGNMDNGKLLFEQIAFEKKVIVCHLINDIIAQKIFNFNIHIHLVIHNDRRAWSTSDQLLSHPNIISLIAVCDYVKYQLEEYTVKPVISVRHQIKYSSYAFNQDARDKKRLELGLQETDIVIGMVGRICEQKNYALAIDVLYHLTLTEPESNYKLVIAGGFEKKFTHIYLDMLNRINRYKIHSNVILLGFRNDVQDLVNTFDVALNCSYFEGLSMATQELMGNSLPVVLSDVCGQKEIYDSVEQLNFFTIPESCSDLRTLKYDYLSEIPSYKRLVKTIADSLIKNHGRIAFKEENLKKISRLCYGSHRLWSLFNHIKPQESLKSNNFSDSLNNDLGIIKDVTHPRDKKMPKKKKTAFLTSNLNLGGAQRSLVNLVTYIQANKEILDLENEFNPPVILINQSNQEQFITQLSNYKIPYYICQSSIDVFDIMKNMLSFIMSEDITQIVFWNVESKIKVLLGKLLGHTIDLVDVSPGDYIFNEIKNEADFQEAIYYTDKEYYKSIAKFVSKFDFSYLNNETDIINDKNNSDTTNINSTKSNEITQTSKTSTEYLSLLKQPAIVIPNGVYMNPIYKRDPSFNTTGIIKEKRDLKILVCGRIAPSKHLDIIFEAFRDVVQKYPDIHLDVIGNVEDCYIDYYNDLCSNYKDLIGDKISWSGYHDNPQSVMKNYDCIIVLGTHQGSPNTVLEAGACNLPVISNDSGGTREVINSSTGILLPAIPHIEPLKEAILSVIEDFELAQIRSEACYEKIKHEFSMQTMAKKYLSILG